MKNATKITSFENVTPPHKSGIVAEIKFKVGFTEQTEVLYFKDGTLSGTFDQTKFTKEEFKEILKDVFCKTIDEMTLI